MIRAVARLGCAATLSVLAGAWLFASRLDQTPARDPQLIFRGGTNLVTVDAYPRRDGRVVEGLKPADFEVLEDGKLQAIDQFEFVRVEPVPEAERRDPNNTREMLQLAADPHNRVFVTYLDVLHVTVTGSHDIRRPLVDMLDRIIAPNDLFGVTTSRLRASSLVLGRKLQSVEQQLARYWPWGERTRIDRDPNDEKETYLDVCFKFNSHGEINPGSDEGVTRPFADILIDRRREESTLANFRELVSYVGTLREARTLLILITDGWRLFRPDHGLQETGLKIREGLRGGPPPPVGSGAVPTPVPPVGVFPGGRLGTLTGLSPIPDDVSCASELARLALLDDQQAFRDILSLANEKNVTFYPVNPGGLEVFDMSLAQPVIPATADMSWHRNRVESARTLADNTDGIAVVDTNNLRAGLTRIVNDVSAYYLLGYYSSNPKADGRYRQIKVRVKQPNVAVAARRGYVAGAVVDRPSEAPPAIDASEAFENVARLDGSDLFTYGVVAGDDLVIVAEISSGQVELGKWRDGGTVKVTVTGAAGEQVGAASGQIEAGARGALVRVPRGTSTGPWRVGVTVVGTSGSLDNRFDVRAGSVRLLSDPLLYRATGVARGAVLRPVAEFLYHRTERVHVEWTILKPLTQRTARVLDRRGQPIPAVAATLTERDAGGRPTLAADLNLAQLSAGDFVLEVTAAAGAETQRRQLAFRVVR